MTDNLFKLNPVFDSCSSQQSLSQDWINLIVYIFLQITSTWK